MTVIAITISAVVCGWSILLVMSDERQRALGNAQVLNAQISAQAAQNAQPNKSDKAKAGESGKRKN